MSSVPVAKLDTEISTPKDYNLILVGGQAVNKLTAEALGVTYPTYGGDALGIAANQATLKLVENAFGGTNTALIVAGWEAADTRAAANVLKDYSAYSATLKGKQVIVAQSGTTITLTAPTVAAA
jgi:S-layer protein (TIGR01564 family)